MNKLEVPKKILIGRGSFEKAADDLASLGSKALIVSGKSMISQGFMEQLTHVLQKKGIGCEIFSGITEEPTTLMVEKGAELYRESGCNFLIGFGGGSPMDAAKAIALKVSTEKNLPEFMGREIDWKLPPIAAIPTTAGTGSEVTRFTIVTDPKTDTKMLLKGESLVPQLAVIDPRFSMSSPRSVTVSSGLDALTHAIEAYTSVKANDMSDSYALNAVEKIFKYLPMVLENPVDKKAREEMAIAATEAGIAFSNSSVTLVHGMSRPIGALFHVPHGISNAMLLVDCLEFAKEGVTDRFAILARRIGAAGPDDGDREAAEKFIKSLKELIRLSGIPVLKDYGLDTELYFKKIGKMTDDAISSGSPANTRRQPTPDQIRDLYRNVMEREDYA